MCNVFSVIYTTYFHAMKEELFSEKAMEIKLGIMKEFPFLFVCSITVEVLCGLSRKTLFKYMHACFSKKQGNAYNLATVWLHIKEPRKPKQSLLNKERYRISISVEYKTLLDTTSVCFCFVLSSSIAQSANSIQRVLLGLLRQLSEFTIVLYCNVKIINSADYGLPYYNIQYKLSTRAQRTIGDWTAIKL